jgi:peptidoglycan/xylan/chitin deacetylase (PgdA/CDA1 family)
MRVGPRLLVTLLLLLGGCMETSIPDSRSRSWTLVEGAPVRGDTSRKRIALIFTGGEFGEGAGDILDALAARGVKAGFFVTGDFLRQPALVPAVRRMVRDGHYVGPHSDSHPLYCPWEDRGKTLVSEDFFVADVSKNIDDLRALGALRDRDGPIYFIPPYEWYNADQTEWSRKQGWLLFNFTPGSGSNRDWAPEDHKSFAPSRKIFDDVLAYEQRDPHGLNGFLLLLHLGSGRKDKMHPLVGPLIDELRRRGYEFVGVDEMLR